MRGWRISKRQVFPIIIALLVQFHLPNISLWQTSAAGISEGAALRIIVDLDKERTVPYRIGFSRHQDSWRVAQLLKSNISSKKIAVRRSIKTAARNVRITITAYSSTRDQTDATPCITANGFNVCKHNRENVIAANFLPFGARVKIPELFGDKEFIVQDRMNRRYGQRIDIWMTSRTRAKQFGVKRATVVVLPEKQKPVPTTPPMTQVAVNF